MSRIFLSFLGTGDYRPIRYRLDGRESAPVEFVQVALLGFLDEPAPAVCILETEAARQKHGEALRRLLPSQTTYVPIREGSNEGQLWELYEQVARVVPAGSELVFDCTHGFRSLAITGAMVATWLRTARDVRIERIVYGAYEAREGEVAPVFDLTAMFELPSWAEAVAEWRRTGRTTGLVERSAPYLKNLRRQLQREAPRALVDLPEALESLGASLRTMRSDKVARQADQVTDLITRAKEELGLHPTLAPLAASLEELGASLKSLLAPASDSREPNQAYLEHQVRLAQWYIEHGDIVEGYSVLRECITSAAVRCVRQAGVGELLDRDRQAHAWHKAKYRTQAEYVLECAAREKDEDNNPEALQLVRAWLKVRPAVATAFLGAIEAVRDRRNKLNHCWTGDDHAREGLDRKGEFLARGFYAAQVDAARKAAESVDGFIQALADRA